MKFRFSMPVSLKFGEGVVKDNRDDFRLGKKALLVTGRSSAKISGAQEDVLDVLSSLGIEFEIFDRAENNPSLLNVQEGADVAKDTGADFIIAIGGGSPLDAAKAVAALSTNDIEPIGLIEGKALKPYLPMIAIPTTSGTGSEVTPYSVLTIPSMRTKKSFASQWAFPKTAFADPSYTNSLPYGITVDTAFDAFSHLIESYYSRRSTPFNDSIAIEGMKAFAECMENLSAGDINSDTREKLMYASCLGGMAITHTGTTLMHAMGYSLTYFRGISHGRANAMLMAEYMRFNESAVPEKTEMVLKILGLKDFNEVFGYFNLGLKDKPVLSGEEIQEFTGLAMGQGSVKMTPRTVSEGDMAELYRNVFGGR